jgi:hypothetical protein
MQLVPSSKQSEVHIVELNFKEKDKPKQLFIGGYSFYLIDNWLKKITKARNYFEWLSQLTELQ